MGGAMRSGSGEFIEKTRVALVHQQPLHVVKIHHEHPLNPVPLAPGIRAQEQPPLRHNPVDHVRMAAIVASFRPDTAVDGRAVHILVPAGAHDRGATVPHAEDQVIQRTGPREPLDVAQLIGSARPADNGRARVALTREQVVLLRLAVNLFRILAPKFEPCRNQPVGNSEPHAHGAVPLIQQVWHGPHLVDRLAVQLGAERVGRASLLLAVRRDETPEARIVDNRAVAAGEFRSWHLHPRQVPADGPATTPAEPEPPAHPHR